MYPWTDLSQILNEELNRTKKMFFAWIKNFKSRKLSHFVQNWVPKLVNIYFKSRKLSFLGETICKLGSQASLSVIPVCLSVDKKCQGC